MKPDEVEHFIQDMMGKVLPSQADGPINPQDFMSNFRSASSQKNSSSNEINAEIFESHDMVFVRIPIKNEEWLKQLRIFHTVNQLIIEHIPKVDDKHTITLPAIVKKKGTSAKCKDGTLEIKLAKFSDLQFSQIEVSEI